MKGHYTKNDIYRMERELQQLELELRARPDRAESIETEIQNLKYELSYARGQVE